jgi:hypothetical protein
MCGGASQAYSPRALWQAAQAARGYVERQQVDVAAGGQTDDLETLWKGARDGKGLLPNRTSRAEDD